MYYIFNFNKMSYIQYTYHTELQIHHLCHPTTAALYYITVVW